MISPRPAVAILIQAFAFVGPLAAAREGFISGEFAGVAAITMWFSAGLPLSYRVLDGRRPASQAVPSRRKVLRPVRL
jgi:hypothetical protein